MFETNESREELELASQKVKTDNIIPDKVVVQDGLQFVVTTETNALSKEQVEEFFYAAQANLNEFERIATQTSSELSSKVEFYRALLSRF